MVQKRVAEEVGNLVRLSPKNNVFRRPSRRQPEGRPRLASEPVVARRRRPLKVGSSSLLVLISQFRCRGTRGFVNALLELACAQHTVCDQMVDAGWTMPRADASIP